MWLKIKGLLFFVFLLSILHIPFSFAQEANVKNADTKTESTGPMIDSVKFLNEIGDTIFIIGNGFGKQEASSHVKIISSSDKEYEAEIKEWTEKEIKAVIPYIPEIAAAESELLKINVMVIVKDSPPAQKEIEIYNIRKLVRESIQLKKKGLSDTAIVDHLYLKKSGFGEIKLTGAEIVALKDATFQDDFIAKFEGTPQYVTVGIAAIWLYSTAEISAAPMLRVFLRPRSYFKERHLSPWRGSGNIFKKTYNFVMDRLDLNFGYTNPTYTTKNTDEIKEKRSYVLVGGSFELNRSALFNFGVALMPGDIKGKEKQLYFGITVDYNSLKEVGLIPK